MVAARTACPAGSISTALRADFRAALTGLLALSLSLAAFPGHGAAQPALEDLIPDSAVADPESWAKQGAPEVPAETDNTQPDASSELEALPDLSLPWPGSGDMPEVEGLEPDPDIQFGEGLDEPLEGLPDGRKVKAGSDVVFVFPDTGADFAVQDEFVDRFRELSALNQYDGDDDGENLAQISARARTDGELLERLLRNYGYYDGYVTRSVSQIQPGQASTADEPPKEPEVRFDIIPGTQYRFGAIDLGALPAAPDHEALRKSFEIWPGDPLLADRIVSESFDLDTALGESGYPFATIGDPSLLVDHARQEGDLTLPVQPGGRYRFGEVVSGRPDFLSSRHLQEIARFDPGDIYKRSDEMDLRRAIVATGLVSSVTIERRAVAPPAGGADGTVVLDVGMTKAKLRTIAGAVGYGSGEGFRVEGSWEHRNLFPPEGALRLRGIAGTKEQLVGATFRRNNWHGRDKVLTLDAYASNVDRDAYAARTASLVGTYERVSTLLYQKKLTWGVGLEVVATDERETKAKDVESARRTYFIGALPFHALYDTSDSLLDPTKGFRVGGRVSPEISLRNNQQSTYVRTQLDVSYYQPLGGKVVIAGRGRAGGIFGTDIANIAPSRRFYAGGGGSVRGYGYQEIGPRDEQDEPNGGRSLVEFSLEARVRTGLFGGAVSVVPFIDGGAVDQSSTPGFKDMRFGAGVGLRYNTGFGPIRVDVATPLNPRPGDNPVAVYVALGQAF